MSSLLGLILPATASTKHVVSLIKPLTPRSLASIRKALAGAFQPVKSSRINSINGPNAAVLVPLANVDGIPGLILEVRGNLRSHAGEVSFPGGRVDKRDPSFLDGALREAEEEIAVKPSQVQLLGELGPAQLSLRGLRVWPYVGFVHRDSQLLRSSTVKQSESANPYPQIDSDAPFPSLRVSSLYASKPEVAHVFHLPFSQLVQPSRLRGHKFRGQVPYWAVDVTDIVASSSTDGATDGAKRVVRAAETDVDVDEVGAGRGGKLEVWGLTGWYLNLLMRALGVYI